MLPCTSANSRRSACTCNSIVAYSLKWQYNACTCTCTCVAHLPFESMYSCTTCTQNLKQLFRVCIYMYLSFFGTAHLIFHVRTCNVYLASIMSELEVCYVCVSIYNCTISEQQHFVMQPLILPILKAGKLCMCILKIKKLGFRRSSHMFTLLPVKWNKLAL